MRSRRVHQYLIDNRTPRTLAQIRDDVLPDCTSVQVQSCLNGLLKTQKIKCVRQHGKRNLYAPISGAPIGRRNQKHPNPEARRQANAQSRQLRMRAEGNAPAKRKPTPASNITIAAATPATNPHGAFHASSKADLSAQIAADVAHHLARGGRIQQLRNGEVSQPLKYIGQPGGSSPARPTHKPRRSAA